MTKSFAASYRFTMTWRPSARATRCRAAPERPSSPNAPSAVAESIADRSITTAMAPSCSPTTGRRHCARQTGRVLRRNPACVLLLVAGLVLSACSDDEPTTERDPDRIVLNPPAEGASHTHAPGEG